MKKVKMRLNQILKVIGTLGFISAISSLFIFSYGILENKIPFIEIGGSMLIGGMMIGILAIVGNLFTEK